MRLDTHFDIAKMRVLDGAMATELERRDCNLAGPLWSAHVLDTSPETIRQVHLDYLRAGADCISTASYQVSARGYAEMGRSRQDAAWAIRRSVELAEVAREEYQRETERPVVIAASLGPYGAALHNGAEFHGRYSINLVELERFHAERLAVIAETKADMVALETIPSLNEARVILAALAGYPTLRAWLSFTCRDAERIAHGEKLADCAAMLNDSDQVVAVGVNCTAPRFVANLITEARTATGKPILVYPNSGESWVAANHRWLGKSNVEEYGVWAASWFQAGAQAVGGCCRTTPEHIRGVRRAWESMRPASMRQ